MPHSVFIASIAKDRRVAESACGALESAGIPCWMSPRDVAPGRPSFGQINEAIRDARLFLLILSKGADGAPAILRQIERAADSYLPILSLQTEDFTPSSDLQYFLGNAPRPEGEEGKDFDVRLAQVVKDVTARLSAQDSRSTSARVNTAGAPATGEPRTEAEPAAADPALATDTAVLEAGEAAAATMAEPVETPAAASAKSPTPRESATTATPATRKTRTTSAAGATATARATADAPTTPETDAVTMVRKPKTSVLEGEKFGHFRVLRKDDGSLHMLGKGAMGVTYKALDTNLERYAALKVVNPALIQDERILKRFRREAQAAARLRHPNIASIFYLGDEQGTLFYAMEFVEGETLGKFIQRKGKLESLVALRLVHQVAQALVAAHRQHLIHRDIKPDNLMITGHDGEDWQIKLIDFGLAKGLERTEGASEASMMGFVGSPAFASPEQCSEAELDIRSDIYSLGVTLWFMLTGRTPFTGPVAQVLYYQVSKPPPVEHLEGIPEEVKGLVLGMLAKTPEERPQTPLDLQHAIETIIRRSAGEVADGSGLPLPSVLPPATRGADTSAGTRGGADDEDAVATLVTSSAATGRQPSSATAAVSTAEGAVQPATAERAMPFAPPGPLDFAAYEALAPGSEIGAAGRYRLERRVSEGPWGRMFQARDTQTQEIVALKILRPDVMLTDPGLRERIRHRLETAAGLTHPNVGRFLESELNRLPAYAACEWLSGWPLLDVLRRRGVFTLRDVLRLMDGFPAVIDYAAEHQPGLLQLAPRKLFVVWSAASQQPEQPESTADKPVSDWPAFILKINPFNLGWLVPRMPAANAEWTFVPDAATTGGGLSKAGISTINSVEALGGLLYELLSGRPPSTRPGAGYTPLSGLNADANTVLRRALQPIGATGRFGSCQEFWTAFREVSGSTAQTGTRPSSLFRAAPGAPVPPPSKLSPASVAVIEPQAVVAPPISTVAPSAFAHVIPPQFLASVEPGTKLRLEPIDPAAEDTAATGTAPKRMPRGVHLVARPLFRVGRSRKEVDFLSWFWPRDAEQDEKTKRLSKVHALAECGADGEITLRDTGSANFTSFETTVLVGDKHATLDRRGVLVLGNDYQLEIVPHGSSLAAGLRVVNADAWAGPPAGEPIRRGCVGFRPLNSDTAMHHTVWIFTDAKFGRDAVNPIMLSFDPGLAGVQGRFHYYRQQFWLEAFDGGCEVRVGDHVLVPGEIVPLTAAHRVALGAAHYQVNVEA